MKAWGLWMFFVWRWRLGYWDVDALKECWRAKKGCAAAIRALAREAAK